MSNSVFGKSNGERQKKNNFEVVQAEKRRDKLTSPCFDRSKL